jgi:hypothetical protein
MPNLEDFEPGDVYQDRDVDEFGDEDLQFIGDSTCIQAAKYNIPTKTLIIQFQDGTIYQYYGVHLFVWYNLLRVLSKGWFFNTRIRNAGYAYDRIG